MSDKIHSVLKWHIQHSACMAAVIGAAGIVFDSSDIFAAQDSATINSLRDIPSKISLCWHPPHFKDQVTVRLSFTRAGVLIGRPRLTYIKSSAGSGTETEVELANSILSAIYACTPLHFTDALGASVAGRVLTIRFIAPQPPTRSAALTSPARDSQAQKICI